MSGPHKRQTKVLNFLWGAGIRLPEEINPEASFVLETLLEFVQTLEPDHYRAITSMYLRLDLTEYPGKFSKEPFLIDEVAKFHGRRASYVKRVLANARKQLSSEQAKMAFIDKLHKHLLQWAKTPAARASLRVTNMG